MSCCCSSGVPAEHLGRILYRFQTRGVSHTMALPFTLKKYLKAKEQELWNLKYFTMQKI
jgi:hypothetical protein